MSAERLKQAISETEKRKLRLADNFYREHKVIVEHLRQNGQRDAVVFEREIPQGQLRIRRDGSIVLDLRTITDEMHPKKRKKRGRKISLFQFAMERYAMLHDAEVFLDLTGREVEDQPGDYTERYVNNNFFEVARKLLGSMHFALLRIGRKSSSGSRSLR